MSHSRRIGWTGIETVRDHNLPTMLTDCLRSCLHPISFLCPCISFLFFSFCSVSICCNWFIFLLPFFLHLVLLFLYAYYPLLPSLFHSPYRTYSLYVSVSVVYIIASTYLCALCACILMCDLCCCIWIVVVVCVYVCVWGPSSCSVDRSLACPGHSRQTKVGFNLIMAERRPP